MSRLKLALAQLKCDLLDKQKNLKRIKDTMFAASKQRADYVFFPELYMTGYVLSREMVDLAEPLSGESIKQVQNYARQFEIGVIVGFPEKDELNIYNTVVFIDKLGNIVGTFRKIHLYANEKEFFTPGDQCPVFTLPEGKIGILITYDMEFPELSRILAVKEAQLIVILAANMVPYQPYQHVYLRARAMENHVFVALVNKVGLEMENLFFGKSEIIHPTGKTIYECGNNEELPVIEIDLEEIEASKEPLDYLKNRRPELYHELCSVRPQI